MEKQRCYKIDNLKTLLIILVVVGHFASQYIEEFDIYKSVFTFIYAFHMPVFIFVSGLFYNPVKAKANSVYYLLIGFALRYFIQLCRCIFCPGLYEFIPFEEGFIPWFAFALAAFNIMMLFVCKQSITVKRVIFVLSIIISCIAGYFPKISDWLCTSRIIVFFPYFLLGTMIELDYIIEISKSIYSKVISAVVILIWAGLCLFELYKVYIFRGLFTGRNPYKWYELFRTWGAFYRFGAYMIAILTGAAVICLVPNIKIPVWTECGKRTMQVFLFHYTFQLILTKIGLADICVTTQFGKIIWLIMAVIVAFFLFAGIWKVPVNWMEELVYGKLLKNRYKGDK